MLIAGSLGAAALSFPTVSPPPGALELPPPGSALVPDSEARRGSLWPCRDDSALVAAFGPDGADRLVRLAAVLDTSRPARLRLLEARGASRETAAQAQVALQAASAALPADVAPALDAEGLEVELRFLEAMAQTRRAIEDGGWSAWEASACSDPVAAAGLALHLAEVTVEVDFATVADRRLAGSLGDALRTGAALLGDSPRRSAVLTALRDLADGHRRLETAESAWLVHADLLTDLATGYRVMEGVGAAIFSEELEKAAGRLPTRTEGVGAAAATVLRDHADRLRELAGRRLPNLITAHPTALDRTGLTADHPRYRIATALIESLRGQLELLGSLYLLRDEREAAFLELTGNQALATHERRAAQLDWYHLSRVAERLHPGAGSEMERAWAWTEVGRLGSRLVAVEGYLADREMTEAVERSDDGSSPALEAVVERQALLTERVMELQRSAGRSLWELDDYRAPLLAQVRGELDSVRRTLAELAPRSEGPASPALAALAGSLDRRRDDLALEGVIEEAFGPAREALRGLDSPLPFSAVIALLRRLPDHETWLAQAETARESLSRLAASRNRSAVDQEVLIVAGALGLPLHVGTPTNGVRFRLGGLEDGYAIELALPFRASTMRPGGGVALALATSPRNAWSTVSSVPFWEKPSELPPSFRRTWGDRIVAVPWAIGEELWGSVPANTALLFVLGPLTGGAAWSAIPLNIIKDVTIGTGKGLVEVLGPDNPAERARLKRALDVSKLLVDLGGIANNINKLWKDGWNLKEAGEAIIDGAGAESSRRGFFDPPETRDEIPYEHWSGEAEKLIRQAWELSQNCSPEDWSRVRSLLGEAARYDPYKQAANWFTVGNRRMQLAYECPDILASFGGVNPLPAALAALENDVRSCDLAEARIKLDRFQSGHYKDVTRCLCLHRYEGGQFLDPLQEVKEFSGPVDQLTRVQGWLAAAEAECVPDLAREQAHRVLTWDPEVAAYFHCRDDLFARAEAIQSAAARRAQAAIAIGAAELMVGECLLDDAQTELDGLPSAPPGCVDETAERRSALLRTIAEQKVTDQEGREQIDQLERALERCDLIATPTLLSALEALDLCDDRLLARRQELAAATREALKGPELEASDQIRIATLIHQAELAVETCDLAGARTRLGQASREIEATRAAPCADQTVEAVSLESDLAAVESALAQAEAEIEAVASRVRHGRAALASCHPEAAAEQAQDAIDAAASGGDPACLAGANDPWALLQEARDAAHDLGQARHRVEAELESAREAADDGDQAGIDAHCLAVQRSAVPAECFGSALQACTGLVPSAVPPPGGFAPVGGVKTVGGSSQAAGPSGGGSGRVQLDVPDGCSADLTWNRTSQSFACTCPGYTFDPDVGRCGSGAGQVTGWIDNATAAFGRCDYDRALWYADQVAARQPSHPWLAANYQTLIRQKQRKDATLSSLQAGQSALVAGDTKLALRHMERAASSTPSCLNTQVSGALDQARGQLTSDRARRDAARREAAGALLGGLINVLNTATAGGSSPTPGGGGGGEHGTPGSEGTAGSASGVTCYVQGYGGNGEVYLLFEHRAQPTHTNYYHVPADEEDAEGVTTAFTRQVPGARLVLQGPYARTWAEVQRRCPNPVRP